MIIKPRKTRPEGVRLITASGSQWPLDLLPEPEWDRKHRLWRWYAVLPADTTLTLSNAPKISISRLPRHSAVSLLFPVQAEPGNSPTRAFAYARTGPNVWTAGTFRPGGRWTPLSDHRDPQEAASRAQELNDADP